MLAWCDVRAVAGDELLGHLLLLHDLHPVDVGTRVASALEEVRPYLGSHGGAPYINEQMDQAALAMQKALAKAAA